MRLYIATLILVTGSSCETTNLPPGTPSCIENEIKKIKKADVRNPPASVWQYNYQERTVYYIPPYCCDSPSVLIDESCNII